MKIYLRILKYAPRLVSRFIQFVIFSLLGAVFSAAYLGLTKPMLEVLFDQTKNATLPSYPEFTFSVDYVRALFDYHFITVIVERGPLNALLFVCITIVCFVFLGNVSRYIERMVASRI